MKYIYSGLLVLTSLSLSAQTGTMVTAVPSLSIAPDARGGGMGDVGAATLPDFYSQYWNPAKHAFLTSKAGMTVSYTPWLRKIVQDIALVYASGFYKFGNEDNQAVSASIRYFSIGDIPERDLEGQLMSTVSPYEMAFDIGYSRKLTETFAGGVTLRYIRTDYSTSSDENTSAGNAFAADIAGYNESYVNIGSVESILGLGFNISNVGTKISMDDGLNDYFLPANLRLGASLTYPLDDYNTLAFNVDLNKLLVPSLPRQEDGEDDDVYAKRVDDVRKSSAISGIFKSFSDSPDGFKGELEEITWSAGMEYAYNDQFMLRGGYYNESQRQGNRKYFSFGAGFKMSSFQLDAAYLISTADSNPLDQTLRFSLGFNMEGLRNLFK
ncbi:type IX secretion system outer membrane channel protein PorV [Dysgonomonas capnocytophagoides]|uniref:Type IX secretion system outer membrane channel protein PorV n=2 Tax=Dysgonomonas capnocytophagoides TaxID=45254 RepID=A0A4Y8KSE6_9BACT|nr:type IX secretion system outer membrane channel protein PorV [Dysgonomonas capnocytophagoides]